MKKFLSLVLFMASVHAFAQDLTWHTDVNKAIEIGMKQKKPLMLFFTGSDWCGWCTRLQNEVFFTKEFKDWSSKNVVLVELDFPRRKQLEDKLKQQNSQLQQMFGVRGYPTVWLVSPEKTPTGVNLKQIGKTGYVRGGAGEWIKAANSILTPGS